MLDALRNAMRIPDLRRKIIYTAAMLAIYRVGSFIPVPGVNAAALAQELGIDGGNIFGFLNLFTGGALARFTVFALGVSPYITASIVLNLLTIVIPKLEELSKEGPEGRKIISQYTRYATVVLALVQALATTLMARAWGVTTNPGFFGLALITITLVAGTSFLMWIGDKISEKGIGNGISMLIFIGIIAELPTMVVNSIRAVGEGGVSALSLILYLIITVAIIAAVVMVTQGQRRIPVQYAKRIVGRKVYGGQSTHIPLKVNQAGVIPVIFASSVLTFPLTLTQFVPALDFINKWLGYGSFGYNVIFVLLVIFFTYFYTAVTFNPIEVADNMKKNGGYIPGLRPGRPTADYLDRVLTRITLPGAIFLAFVAVLPSLVAIITRVPTNLLYFGGTGILIMVGVALETMQQIEAHLLMRHYEGFLK
ncbi:MAG TPA: preprotein translocase subunit SecY [Firmicutes bacterium]|nr:MAG: preprotein translocase subunit SecY [Peptococcaceae bacterium 1109]HHT73939.1 preprotein translocase subunit SecY [Bacillota bacterium]